MIVQQRTYRKLPIMLKERLILSTMKKDGHFLSHCWQFVFLFFLAHFLSSAKEVSLYIVSFTQPISNFYPLVVDEIRNSTYNNDLFFACKDIV